MYISRSNNSFNYGRTCGVFKKIMLGEEINSFEIVKGIKEINEG